MPIARIASTCEENGLKRCPACGLQYTLVYEPRCPHCQADIPVEHVTSEDSTPFARAGRIDRHTVRQMRRWIYASGSERLNYLALVRRSRASRSFARRHLILIAVAATLYQLSHVGWHRVVRTQDNVMLITTTPSGKAWFQIASTQTTPATYGMVAMWWSPVQAGVTLIVSMVAGLLLAYIMLLVLNFGAGPVLGAPYRQEERLRGAIHYSTAWSKPLYYAGWIILLVPLRDLLAAAGVGIVPPTFAIRAGAAVVAAVAALMWWFWLIRLAMALPRGPRTRVAVYYSVVAPALATGLLIGWSLGMERLLGLFWSLFKLTWSGG